MEGEKSGRPLKIVDKKYSNNFKTGDYIPSIITHGVKILTIADICL